MGMLPLPLNFSFPVSYACIGSSWPSLIFNQLRGARARIANAARSLNRQPTRHATANTIEMLALYLGMLDADFTVTEPPELLERLNRLSRRFSSAARLTSEP